MPPHKKIWMTDLALTLPGAAARGLAGDGSVATPDTWPLPNSNPAALKRPTRMTSRRDNGMLKVMQTASAVGSGRLGLCVELRSEERRVGRDCSAGAGA